MTSGPGATHTLLHGARVVTPAEVLEDGWVVIDGGRIAAVGSGGPPPAVERSEDLRGAWLLPGFVDLHVHGGGGHDAAESGADVAAAAAFHRRHGTTRTLVSLVTAPVPELERQLGQIAELVAQDAHGIVGAHLEGPFLSASHRGAQNPNDLLMPDPAILTRLLDAALGCLSTMTIAPELPGAIEIIERLVDAGVVPAIGHTGASYDQTARAIDAGATLATHLFNGMPAMHHREPGAAGAVLTRGIACEVINDGTHVHPALLRLVAQSPGRLVLVTDAIRAAGVGDGAISLAGQPIEVRANVARVVATGSLAGSTLTMDLAVRRAVVDSGLSIVAASAAASANPARVIGLGRTGSIVAGLDADLVVLDPELRLRRVMARGHWEPAPSPSI